MKHLTTKLAILAASALVTLQVTPAQAHHSASAYDFTKTVQYEGVLTEVKIINPHAIWKVKVAGPNGTSEEYQFHGAGVTLLRNTGVATDEFKPGVKVHIAGNANRNNAHDVLISNLMGPSGKEWRLGVPGALPKPLWSQNASGGFQDSDQPGVKDPAAAKLGILRTWSPRIYFSDEERKGFQSGSRNAEGKFTPAAQVLLKKNMEARFKMEKDGTLPPCYYAGGGFNGGLVTFNTTSFVKKGDTIEMRNDGDGHTRVIYLKAPAKKPTDPKWGYSEGHWEGSTLVVTTTGVNWVGKGSGFTPQPVSDQVVYVEKFTPSADGARLDYESTTTDPVYLTGPQMIQGHWIWKPGAQLKYEGCSKSYHEPPKATAKAGDAKAG